MKWLIIFENNLRYLENYVNSTIDSPNVQPLFFAKMRIRSSENYPRKFAH